MRSLLKCICYIRSYIWLYIMYTIIYMIVYFIYDHIYDCIFCIWSYIRSYIFLYTIVYMIIYMIVYHVYDHIYDRWYSKTMYCTKLQILWSSFWHIEKERQGKNIHTWLICKLEDFIHSVQYLCILSSTFELQQLAAYQIRVPLD